jgi:hypothetical protein
MKIKMWVIAGGENIGVSNSYNDGGIRIDKNVSSNL